MDSSSGFGSTPCDWTLISNSLSLRLPYSVKLATECKSLTHYAKGTQSPLTRLLLFVCMRFQVLFHSPPGVLFAFPSRYWFTIGRSRVFSLGGWSPRLRTGFHVSRSTSRFLSTVPTLSPTGLSPTIAGLSRTFRLKFVLSKAGLLRVRSPLLPESRLISFLRILRCFSSLRSPCITIYSSCSTDCSVGFPHSDIYGSMLVHNSP